MNNTIYENISRYIKNVLIATENTEVTEKLFLYGVSFSFLTSVVSVCSVAKTSVAEPAHR